MASQMVIRAGSCSGTCRRLLDELLPDREASDAVFRLTLSVLQELRGAKMWMPVTYFELWMTRLMGSCRSCRSALSGTLR